MRALPQLNGSWPQCARESAARGCLLRAAFDSLLLRSWWCSVKKRSALCRPPSSASSSVTHQPGLTRDSTFVLSSSSPKGESSKFAPHPLHRDPGETRGRALSGGSFSFQIPALTLGPLFSGLSITLCLNEELLKLQKMLTLQPWHLNFGVV